MGQWCAVYNALSFGIAGMGAATLFFWLQLPNLTKTYRTPLIITGLVTAIATYHYVRIFNSWVNAFSLKQTDDSYAVSLFRGAFQRRLPVRGLAAHGATAADRAHLGDAIAGRGKRKAQLGTWGIERDHGGAGLPRRDPKQRPGTLVLVVLRDGALLRCCFGPGRGPQQRHGETAPLCAGARDQGAIPHGDLLVDVSGRLHHQERGYRRPSRNHMGAGRLLRGGLHRKGCLRRLDLGHRCGKVQAGGGRGPDTKVSVAASTLLTFFVPRLVVGPHIPRDVVVRSELCAALQTVIGVAFAALRGCSTIRLGSVRLLLRSLLFRPELCRGLSLHAQRRAHVASFCSGSRLPIYAVAVRNC